MGLKKLLMTISLISAIFPVLAQAAIDRNYESKISNACISSGRTKNIRDLEKICKCVGREHFNSALREPYESEAISQLSWVVEYYSETDPNRLKQIAERPGNLVDFDMDVMNECLEKVRGK